jgi:hypothetical protein
MSRTIIIFLRLWKTSGVPGGKNLMAFIYVLKTSMERDICRQNSATVRGKPTIYIN